MLPPTVNVPVQVNAFVSEANRNESVLVAVPVRVKLAIVIPPLLKVKAADPVQTIDMPFQLIEAPPMVCPAPVIVTVAVFAVTVKPVTAPVQVPPAEVIVIWLAPIVSVRVFELFDENDPHEHVCPLVFNVPVVSVIAPVRVVPALWVSVKSDLLMVMEAAERATSTVTVAAVPEFASKSTLSPAIGTV